MKVGEIARHTGLSAHTVRYYERIGLLDAARDSENNYRRFGAPALARLRFVRQAKRLGFSLREIREILETCASGESPCPMVRDIVRARIAENRLRIDALQRLQARLEEALRQWAGMPDGEPDGHAVCRLIEAIAADEA